MFKLVLGFVLVVSEFEVMSDRGRADGGDRGLNNHLLNVKYC